MNDMIDYVFGFFLSSLVILAFSGASYALYWDYQEKLECKKLGIPLAACEHYNKHDISLERK